MNRLTEEILNKEGFEFDKNLGIFTKAVEGRTIICHKPNIDENAGYWICEICTTDAPVKNSKIVTNEELLKFIDSTCPDKILSSTYKCNFLGADNKQ